MDSQIVEEFRKYEFLYNKEMPEYLDRERARRAYEEIGMTRRVDWPCQYFVCQIELSAYKVQCQLYSLVNWIAFVSMGSDAMTVYL